MKRERMKARRQETKERDLWGKKWVSLNWWVLGPLRLKSQERRTSQENSSTTQFSAPCTLLLSLPWETLQSIRWYGYVSIHRLLSSFFIVHSSHSFFTVVALSFVPS
jgi:hypothetical protein